MTASRSTKEQIIVDLRDSISQILSIPTTDIEKSKDFWELFPPGNRYEPTQVTHFVLHVSNTYKVYLSEREWEASTLAELADHILERQASPQLMLEQIKEDMANQKKGLRISLIAFPVMFGLCGVIFYLTEPTVAVKLRGLLVCLGGTVFAELIVLFLDARENKKFNAEVQPVLKHYHLDMRNSP